MRRVLLPVLFLASTMPVLAHHGAGTFELSKTVTFETATLTRIDFVNPHSWLYFDVTEPDGKVSHHRCEMRSVHTLRRSGWTNDRFKTPQKIKVEASPDRVDPNSCYLQTITFADGTHMDRYGQYVKAGSGLQEVRGKLQEGPKARATKLPSGEPNLAGDWAPEQVVMANPKGTGGGLVPLSTIANATPGRPGGARRGGGPPAGPRLYGGSELTPQGEKEAAAFKREDNPRFSCLTTSILFDWTFDGPVNRITQTKNQVVIEYGQMGLKRTVFMNMKEHPAGVKGTRAGHSIGRWEGDTLVVDTVGFLPGVLNAPVRHSDKLHVVERFSLDSTGTKLTREYVADDPVYLKGKYTGSDTVEVADAPFAADKCKDTSFVQYKK